MILWKQKQKYEYKSRSGALSFRAKHLKTRGLIKTIQSEPGHKCSYLRAPAFGLSSHLIKAHQITINVTFTVIKSLQLTSEMKVAQMVCKNLLGSVLCIEFDSAWEKDVSFPSRDSCMTLVRHFYIRHMNDIWKLCRLVTVRKTQVAHGGTFHCCIYGTTHTRNTLF